MEPHTLPSLDDPLLRALRRTLRERRLVRTGDSVLVACSGGADSTALLLALAALAPVLRITLAVGHVNHGLRGEESDADAEWVSRLAVRLGLPLGVRTLDVRQMRKDRGGSLEEVARRARYEALHEIAEESGARKIAVAHHLEDQAETVLMHLLRGAGLAGLGGMSWSAEGGVIRPFLATRRDEIRRALLRWNVSWREDSSNESLAMTRNRLRHVLLPLLEREWNPRIVPALSRLAEIAAADENALETWVEKEWPLVVRKRSSELVVLDRTTIRSYPLGIVRRIIRRATPCLRTVRTPLSYAETVRLASLAMKKSAVVLRGRLNAWSTESDIVLEAADAWRGPTAVTPPGEVRVPEWGTLRVRYLDDLGFHQGEYERPPSVRGVRYAKAAVGLPLLVRRWRSGDRISRGGRSPLIADLARALVPPADRRRIVIVEDPDRIIWAPGIAAMELPGEVQAREAISLEWEREADG